MTAIYQTFLILSQISKLIIIMKVIRTTITKYRSHVNYWLSLFFRVCISCSIRSSIEYFLFSIKFRLIIYFKRVYWSYRTLGLTIKTISIALSFILSTEPVFIELAQCPIYSLNTKRNISINIPLSHFLMSERIFKYCRKCPQYNFFPFFWANILFCY